MIIKSLISIIIYKNNREISTFHADLLKTIVVVLDSMIAFVKNSCTILGTNTNKHYWESSTIVTVVEKKKNTTTVPSNKIEIDLFWFIGRLKIDYENNERQNDINVFFLISGKEKKNS